MTMAVSGRLSIELLLSPVSWTKPLASAATRRPLAPTRGRSSPAWACSPHKVTHLLNQPGCLTQNAYIESFNGKYRDERLNEHWFEKLHQARSEIAAWRVDSNEIRPHSTCGRTPPARLAALHWQHAANAARPNQGKEQAPTTTRKCSSLRRQLPCLHTTAMGCMPGCTVPEGCGTVHEPLAGCVTIVTL